MVPETPAPHPAPTGLAIGHVHLKVSDLERSIGFYAGVLGLDVVQRYGPAAVFLSAGGYHHHIGLNTWESAGGTPPPPGHTGLFHTAFVYPTRPDLGAAVQRVIEAGLPIDGAADHGMSEAVYLRDPDQNGVELYWDKPRDQWPLDDVGHLRMTNVALDVGDLCAAATSGSL